MKKKKQHLSFFCSVSLATVEYFVPLAVITFAYVRIAFRLWGSKTPGAAQDERDHNILVNKKKVWRGRQETRHRRIDALMTCPCPPGTLP